MKQTICILLAAVMLLGLAACGGSKPAEPVKEDTPAAPAQEAADWTREGFFQDEKENMLSVTWMDDVDEPGWYVGFMNGQDPIEDSYGGMLPTVGNTLSGSLPSSGSKDALTVTVSEEGEDGLLVAVEGGESYHFKPMVMETPFATLWVNTEGLGTFSCREEGDDSELDTNTSSLQYGLTEPTNYELTAYPGEDWHFEKWTLNGEDYSSDVTITLEVSQDTDIVAVFAFNEEDGGDGQNPVMNFIGNYACDRARALVECSDDADGARITIEWGGSAWELARWVITGRLDTDTLTVEYADCVKSIVICNDDGSVKSDVPEYENGTGRIVFGENGTFTWHEDQADREADLVFKWVPAVTE